jgi:short-subunit dehydrogenase
MNSSSLRVLITGASSGLGAEMARQLAAEGARVAITGRRAEKLEQAAGLARKAGAKDVIALLGSASEHETVARHYAEIKTRWGGLDWAILNAGISEAVNALNFSAKPFRNTFETNIFGAAEWMEAVLPDMIAQNSGTIAGISSLASFRGLPNSGAYSSSKAAFNTLLEAARIDLRETGVRVVTVCPGFVKSEITAANDPRDMVFLLETADGAKRILDGIRAGRRIVHFPWPLSWPMKYILGNMPGWLYDSIVGRLIKRRRIVRNGT